MKINIRFIIGLLAIWLLVLTAVPISVMAKIPINSEVQTPAAVEKTDDSGNEIPPEITSTTTTPISLYRTHVQNEGWQDWKNNGEMSGTSGKGLRLEGIEIKLDKQGYDVGVSYSTHVQNIGCQASKSDGAMSGTSGQSLRLEAIRINLTGSDAQLFDIYYQVHAQNYGWLDWAKNGGEAGTQGLGLRLEGICVVITPKGNAAPGSTATPYISSDAFLKNIQGEWYDHTLNVEGPHLKIREPNVEAGLLWLGIKWYEYRYRIVSISRDGQSGTIEAYKWNYYKPYKTGTGSTGFQKVEMDVNPPDQYVYDYKNNTLTEHKPVGSNVKIINYVRN